VSGGCRLFYEIIIACTIRGKQQSESADMVGRKKGGRVE